MMAIEHDTWAMQQEREKSALDELSGAELPVGESNQTLQELSTNLDMEGLMQDYYGGDMSLGRDPDGGLSIIDEAIEDAFGTKKPPPANQEGQKKDEDSRSAAFSLPGSPVGRYRSKLAGLRGQTQDYLDKASDADKERLGAEHTLHTNIKSLEDARTRRIHTEKTDLKKAEDTRQKALTQSRTDISNAVDMVLNSEIDPNRIYKSTGQKIGAALAMALGAAGSALTGTENGAMRVLQTAIDRDIAAQRMEIDGLKFIVGQKQNAYSMLREQHGDERKVEELMRAMAHQHIDNQIQALKTQYNLDANQSRLTAIEARNKAEMTKVNERYATLLFNGEMAEWSANMSLLGRPGSGKSGDLGMSVDLTSKLNGALMSQKMLEDLIADVPGTDNIGMDGKIGTGGAFYGNNAAFVNKRDRLAMRVVNALSGANFTEEQLKEVRRSLPGWTDRNSTKVRKLKEVLKEINQQIETIGSLVPLDKQEEFNARFMPQDESQQIKGI
tara:strand:- start:439 stop:1935 length:1497 start_codon:yes stop_codon:yes gene_type:complete